MHEFRAGDALLVIDVQRDFCPGGRLAVEGGDEVVPVLNRWIESAERAGAPIYASRDWHPEGHASFEERGGSWPEHCVQGTDGAEFHPDLSLPERTRIITKGSLPETDQYSAFDRTGLGAEMRRAGVERVWLGGLALEVCVRASALDAAEKGFETHLIRDACRAIDAEPGDGERAIEDMRRAGAKIEETDE
jgi:nicotinamidase/pyrazinamidase